MPRLQIAPVPPGPIYAAIGPAAVEDGSAGICVIPRTGTVIPMPTRRTFLLAAAGLALTPALARCVSSRTAPAFLKAVGPRRPDKLRIACIGTANRAWDNIQEVRSEQIVALCDVDSAYLERAGNEFPDAARAVEWQQVVEYRRELDLDGIVIATPDHAHFPMAAAALRAGIPVYCEKPLTHTREQAVELRRLARAARVPTQMGTQIHATDNYRRVVEAVRAGVIGRVTAVDCWQLKSWGDGKLTPGAVCPATLDWNAWLCGTPSVPYINGIHPANWRRYWAYGSGTLGDMGCHIMDLPVWALGLAPCADLPAGAVKGGTSTIPLKMEVRADGPPIDVVGTPAWLEASWAMPGIAAGPAGVSLDPLLLRWFDGGRMSPFVQEIGAKDKQDYHGRFSVCFQGTEGALFANYDEMLVWPGARAAEWSARVASGTAGITPLAASRGHHAEWLQAIRDGAPSAPLCNFEYSGRLTELVLAGTEAYRVGKQIDVTIQ